MRKLLAYSLSVLMLITSALVGVPVANAQVASTTVFTLDAARNTYKATIVGLTPAASATDFFTITGAANRIVRVTELECTGLSTADAMDLIQVIKRSTVDTGGTPVTTTPVPLDSTNTAAVASVKNWTANPGALGTAVGSPLGAKYLYTGKTATPDTVTTPVKWTFGTNADEEPVLLRSAAQQLALNNNAASFPAGTTLTCSVTWEE